MEPGALLSSDCPCLALDQSGPRLGGILARPPWAPQRCPSGVSTSWLSFHNEASHILSILPRLCLSPSLATCLLCPILPATPPSLPDSQLSCRVACVPRGYSEPSVAPTAYSLKFILLSHHGLTLPNCPSFSQAPTSEHAFPAGTNWCSPHPTPSGTQSWASALLREHLPCGEDTAATYVITGLRAVSRWPLSYVPGPCAQ